LTKNFNLVGKVLIRFITSNLAYISVGAYCLSHPVLYRVAQKVSHYRSSLNYIKKPSTGLYFSSISNVK